MVLGFSTPFVPVMASWDLASSENDVYQYTPQNGHCHFKKETDKPADSGDKLFLKHI